jgi:DNA-binding response OmpR family regulator
MSMSLVSTPVPQTLPDDVEFVISQLNTAHLDRALAGVAAKMIADLASRLPCKERVITVDLGKNLAVREGVIVLLSPNQASVLYTLTEVYPRIVSVAELCKAVYGARPPRSPNTMRVMMTDLRARIAPLRAGIGNLHGRGYRLDLEPVE